LVKRIRLSRKANSKLISVTSAPAPRWTLFGQPPLLGGEDAPAYDQLLAKICAAVKPIDIIDEMFIFELVSLEWEVLRWRRLKSSLIQAHGLEELKDFLDKKLKYALYKDHFVDCLAEILRDNLPGQPEDFAHTLTQAFARNEPDADEKVNEVLAGMRLDMDDILKGARGRKANELVQQYLQREPDAVALVDDLLADAGVSMDTFMAEALVEKLDAIERIDRLTAVAENRRNDSLHEIERRRVVLGGTLRRSVHEIEDGEFEEIETTPAKGSAD
jgi:hypothetical protein